jgi:hypothetical protein
MNYQLPDGTKTADVATFEDTWLKIGEDVAQVLGGVYDHADGHLLYFKGMDGLGTLPLNAALRIRALFMLSIRARGAIGALGGSYQTFTEVSKNTLKNLSLRWALSNLGKNNPPENCPNWQEPIGE